MTAAGKIPNSYVNLIVLLTTAVASTFMPLLSLIMTGKSYSLLFITLFITVFISIGIGDSIARALGQYKIRWYSRAIWAEVELRATHVGLSLSAVIISRGAVYFYPVIIGYGYFGGIYSSEQWSSFFLQTTILMLFIMPYLAEVPKTILALSNENMMTYQRSRTLINHLLTSSQLFLLVAFMFWDLGWQGQSIVLLSGNIIISTTLVATFIFYYALFFFFPYMKGQYSAHRWRTQLEQKRRDIIERSENIFNLQEKNNAAFALAELIKKCEAELNAILQMEAIQLAQHLLQTGEEDKKLNKIAIKDASPRDPRFRHLSFMKQAQLILQQYEHDRLNVGSKEQLETLNAEARNKLAQALPPLIDNTSPYTPIMLSAIIGIALSMAASTVGHSIAKQLS